VIEGSKISRVADARGTATYDLSGLTVMPGWIDTHTHPGWYFNRENRLEQGGRGSIETPAASALYAEANVYATLMGGFTTIQSVGQEVDKDLRDLINRGVLPGPRIATAAAEPPDDPPAMRSRFHGLWTGPCEKAPKLHRRRTRACSACLR
jgi:imidazolonepropionase-like amidohydrolase